MFIYNIKLSGGKLFKVFFGFVIIIMICIVGVVIFKLFNGADNASSLSSCSPQSDVNKIESKNYTNVLKTVHENIDTYVGKKINFTGYVYRILDLNDNQFVLARNMIISSDFQYVVVGFLCECDSAKDFENDVWVNITGEIVKGDYHGDMPIIKITEINRVDKPSEEFVYPPDESYIPTNNEL